jgi:hypothetical protein
MTATTEKRIHMGLAAAWFLAAFPIMLSSLRNSIALVIFISVYANCASHISAAQAARAEQNSPDR